MNEPILYTEIPDTSDSNYWESKINNHITVYVPKDKELHHKLKVAAWAVIQASQTKKNKNKGY